ncbi:hypothetical protein B0H13DRAFT_2668275 [Mycena leptocephala]|nr:hypothetical protein B0H13DRAFT_2668275 [Mycena leptocephala]
MVESQRAQRHSAPATPARFRIPLCIFFCSPCRRLCFSQPRLCRMQWAAGTLGFYLWWVQRRSLIKRVYLPHTLGFLARQERALPRTAPTPPAPHTAQVLSK